MKIKDLIKKQTTIVAIAAVLVAVLAISVSYALFFDVKKNTNSQVITAGKLKLTLSGVKAVDFTNTGSLPGLKKGPMSDEEGLKQTPITYTIQNTEEDSNLPSTYDLYVCAVAGNTVPTEAIKVVTSASGVAAKESDIKRLKKDKDEVIKEEEKGKVLEGPENIKGNDCYHLENGKAGVGQTLPSKDLRIWIDEDSLTSDLVGSVLDINLYIIAEVNEEAAIPSSP